VLDEAQSAERVEDVRPGMVEALGELELRAGVGGLGRG
jgi:hypothetical protein